MSAEDSCADTGVLLMVEKRPVSAAGMGETLSPRSESRLESRSHKVQRTL